MGPVAVFTQGNVYVAIILMLVFVLTADLPVLAGPAVVLANICLLAFKANQSLT